MATATTSRLSLREYLEELSLLEDARDSFKPEYLTLDEDSEEERLCEGCEDRNCDNSCGLCLQEVISGANRLIHTLLTKGVYRVPGLFGMDSECLSPSREKVSFCWDSEYGEDFCRKCRMYGNDACPEDVNDESCARRATVKAIYFCPYAIFTASLRVCSAYCPTALNVLLKTQAQAARSLI